MDRECSVCHEPICEHGICYCDDDHYPCRECGDRRDREAYAAIETAWQRDVMGPLLGFKKEEDD